MNKETMTYVGNTIPYGLAYAYFTQNLTSKAKFIPQFAGFFLCTTTWYLSQQYLNPKNPAPVLLHRVPEYLINSQYYSLFSRIGSGVVTGSIYAFTRKNNMLLFGTVGAFCGILNYLTCDLFIVKFASMPVNALVNHLIWINPFEKVDHKELKIQYETELNFVRSEKNKAIQNIHELTKKINEN
eukprot:NODE_337_length_9297_cov_0.873994.p6 type:complete len:184 gc:universal NODE_337_length_9297_cov_0.873994:3714-4265(+)